MILHCKTMYCCRMTPAEYIYHIGNIHNMHSVIQGGSILKRDRQSVFHSREPDVRQTRSGRSSIRSRQTQNRGVQKTWRIHQKIFWCSLKHAQRKRMQFYPTRSHAIALFNTPSAICIAKVENMLTGEVKTAKYTNPQGCRASYSRQIRNMDVRILLIPKSTDHRSERSVKYRDRKHPGESQRWKYRETRRGNVDCRIPGIPHSTVQREDSNRKEKQFENHPNTDSLIQDLNKTEEFNPFSEKSRRS